MSFAVIKTGGKQHKVSVGDKIKVEKLEGNVGDSITLNEVLMTSSTIGSPLVSGAKVSATIKAQGRGAKIRVFKRLRRKGFHKTIGHRQSFTELEITAV